MRFRGDLLACQIAMETTNIARQFSGSAVGIGTLRSCRLYVEVVEATNFHLLCEIDDRHPASMLEFMAERRNNRAELPRLGVLVVNKRFIEKSEMPPMRQVHRLLQLKRENAVISVYLDRNSWRPPWPSIPPYRSVALVPIIAFACRFHPNLIGPPWYLLAPYFSRFSLCVIFTAGTPAWSAG